MNSSIDTFTNASVTKMNRDERWEARRKARLGIEPPQQIPNQFFTQPEPASKFDIQPDLKSMQSLNPHPPTFQPVFNSSPQAMEPPSNTGQIARQQPGMMPPSAMIMSSNLPQDSFLQFEDRKLPPTLEYDRKPPPYEENRKAAAQPKAPEPVGNSFFTNPISDAELKRRRMQEEYRTQMQVEAAQPKAPEPVGNSFFTNPISDAELKRRRMLEEYRTQMQVEAAQPKAPEPDSYARHRADYGAGPNPSDQQQAPQQDLAKRQYQQELQRQIAEKQTNKRHRAVTPPKEEYFPFGRPGAGAPNRDVSGNIVANRPPRFNENDPKFLRPRQFYEQLGVPADPNSYGQIPNLPQQYPPMQSYSNPQQYPPMQSYSSPQGYNPPPQYAAPVPNYPPSSYPNYPSQSVPPRANYSPPLPEPLPNYPPAASQYPQSIPNYPPIDNPASLDPADPQNDYEKQVKLKQKNDLSRALQEQMEERKRKKEEEKRQEKLEERLEEERLERERKKMEEEYKREQEKKKKDFQDLQSFNSNVLQAPPPPPPNKRRRPITPIDLPTAPPTHIPAQIFEPARAPSREMLPSTKIQQQDGRLDKYLHEPPIDLNRQIQTSIENELFKIKNEMNYQQNELQSTLVQLKNETLLANEQRYEAQKELERIKEEMRKRNIEEEIRQRELFQALVNPNPQPGFQPTRLPPLQPTKLELPRGRNDPKIELDKSLSLGGDSKFIPVPVQDLTIKEPIFENKPLEIKKAYHLDDLFPSLPEGGGMNLTTLHDRTTSSAFSTLGIDAIVRRNDERLLALENYEKIKEGESGMDQIDELLHSYLHKAPAVPPSRASSKYTNNSALNIIKEYDEDGTFSLPSRDSNRSKRVSSFARGNIFTKNANLIL